MIHQHPNNDVGHFPEWMPYLNAGLLYKGYLITKKQDRHVTTTTSANTLQDTIIKDSKKHDPTIDIKWTEESFKSVDWQANGSSLKALAPGQQLQITKDVNAWLDSNHAPPS
jgi:hypothetical protein